MPLVAWVALVVIGVLVALAVLRRMMVRQAATRITSQVEAAFAADQEIVTVDPGAFPGLDVTFYDGAEAALAAHGFRRIADFENRTLTRVFPARRTFVRVLGEVDGETRAAIYEVPLYGKPSLRTVELISERASGIHLVTTTAPANRRLDPPPTIVREHTPEGTDPARLVEIHRGRLEAWRRARPDCRPRPVLTTSDAIAAWNRQTAAARAQRIDAGGVTTAELERIAGDDPGRLSAAREIGAELDRRKDAGK